MNHIPPSENTTLLIFIQIFMKQQSKKIRGGIVGGSGLIGGAFVHYFNKCGSKDIEIL
jgi:hypothetical protein